MRASRTASAARCTSLIMAARSTSIRSMVSRIAASLAPSGASCGAEAGASTAGSTYDTVLSVSTGACGSLVERACADDVGRSSRAALDLVVTSGVTYYIEVTSALLGGGTLHLTLDVRFAARCAPAPLAGCRVPTVAGAATLRLTDVDPAHRQLSWKWTRGAATAPADLGDPTTDTGTSYALCLYDATSSLVAVCSIDCQ